METSNIVITDLFAAKQAYLDVQDQNLRDIQDGYQSEVPSSAVSLKENIRLIDASGVTGYDCGIVYLVYKLKDYPELAQQFKPKSRDYKKLAADFIIIVDEEQVSLAPKFFVNVQSTRIQAAEMRVFRTFLTTKTDTYTWIN